MNTSTMSAWLRPLVCFLIACSDPAPPPTAPSVPVTPTVFPDLTASPPPPVIPAVTAPQSLEATPDASPRLAPSPDAVEQLSERLPPAQRTLYIQADRPLYRPGDTIWVQTWDLEAATLDNTRIQGVTYTLTREGGQRVVWKRVKSVDGIATNDLQLPGDIPGGMYTLTAMTDDDVTASRPVLVTGTQAPQLRKELTFLRDAYGPGETVIAAITVSGSASGALAGRSLTGVVQVGGEVIDRVDVLTDDSGGATVRFTLPEALRTRDGNLSVIIRDGALVESISRAIPILIEDISVDFYPEGGDLVAGLPSRVYLRARDPFGKPADLAGEIRDSRGEVVAQVRTAHDGLGRFDLTPRPGERYHLHIAEPTRFETMFWLPRARTGGCVLRTFDDLDGVRDAIRARVSCTTAQTVLVSAARDGALTDTAQVNVTPDTPAVVYLDDHDHQGVATVTVSDTDLHPIAERLVYRGRDRQLTVTITPDADGYTPRDQVTLRIHTTDHQGAPVSARLAVSVADDTLLSYADDKAGHILSRMYLEGALPQKVEEPGWYFDPEEELAALGLDLLMGTLGWRRMVKRQTYAAGTPARSPHMREEEGKAGKKDAKMERAKGHKVELHKKQLDREIAESAGILGALSDTDELNVVFGSSDLNSDLAGGIGGLLGAKSSPLGTRVLGARGDGLGGGGLGGGGLGGGGLGGGGLGGGDTAAGLGGLGTKGRGYGSGSDSFMGRGVRGHGRVGGDPIILGAMDRSRIDAVVSRHMNQIRYCYQRELTKNPTLAGKIVVKFVIARDGSVSQASTRSSTMGSPAVEGCINGRFMRFHFPSPVGDGVVIVSYPFLFSPDGIWPAQGESMYATVREFPRPSYSGPPPQARTDFRDTVLWDPSVETNARGEATVRFHLSDQVTTFRVTAEGAGGGQVGRGEATLTSALPFSMSLRLPEALGAGDRMVLPVLLRNNRTSGVSVALSGEIEAPLMSAEGLTQTARLAGGGISQLTHIIDAMEQGGEARLTLRADAAGLSDQIDAVIPVTRNQYPGTLSVSGTVRGETTHTFTLDETIEGTLEAALVLHSQPVSQLMEGIEGLLSEPGGCFEQTSSRNYPNTMVLRLLETSAHLDASVVSRARGMVDRGYARLVTFESDTGGFDWYPNGTGHEGLTAYGLQQFTDMARVYAGVSPEMLARTGQWLRSRRDGRGGYEMRDRRRFGQAPPEVTAGYITHSLIAAGQTAGLSQELDAQERIARESEDPYLLALAALSLLRTERTPAGRLAASKLADLQDASGAWTTAAATIVLSGERDRNVETTGLATLALLASGRHTDRTDRAIHWLYTQRYGNGTFGATQATVIALKAIVAWQALQPEVRGGKITVLLNGEPAQTVDFTGQELSAIEIPNLEGALKEGENTLTIRNTSGSALPFAFHAAFQATTPVSSPNAPLDLGTTLLSQTVGQGETVRLTARVRNRQAQPVSNPMVRLGIPAGLSADLHQLKRMVERGELALFELHPREAVLYLDGIEGAGERTLHLDLHADVPGTYTAPPSSAWLYYDADHRDWAPGEAITITL
ncbi:MAG: AgmX/PglI C-terminal domain-containing protein [Myxococcota bacterium]